MRGLLVFVTSRRWSAVGDNSAFLVLTKTAVLVLNNAEVASDKLGRSRKEVRGLDARGDLIKYLEEKIGAVAEEKRGRKHRCWRIGSVLFPIPGRITGVRQLENYKAKARAIAAQQGLRLQSASAQSGEDVSPAERHTPERRPRRKKGGKGLSPPAVEEATTEEVRGWIARNRLKEMARRERMIEEARVVEEGTARISNADRIRSIERAIRERGPMTAEEICKYWDWRSKHDLYAVGRLLIHDRVFQQLDQKKRRGRFTLVELANPREPRETKAGEQSTQPGAVMGVTPQMLEGMAGLQTAAEAAPVEQTRQRPEAAAAAAELEMYRRLIGEIEKVVSEFRGSDPNRACFVLGQIDGLIRALMSG